MVKGSRLDSGVAPRHVKEAAFSRAVLDQPFHPRVGVAVGLAQRVVDAVFLIGAFWMNVALRRPNPLDLPRSQEVMAIEHVRHRLVKTAAPNVGRRYL